MVLALEIILLISAILMSIFVLLHKGKGGGLSSLFGGGVQSNLSGSTVVEKNLDRYTVVMVIIWLACIVGRALIQASASEEARSRPPLTTSGGQPRKTAPVLQSHNPS